MDLIKANWGLYLVEGILLVLLGMFAIGSPAMMTLSIEMLVSILLIVGGVIMGIGALSAHKEPGFGVTLVSAIISIFAGILLLSYPFVGAMTLTLLLTIFFFVEGIARIISAFEWRRYGSWVWLLLSGILSVILAILIWSQWPVSAMWVIGLYVGIYLLFLGFSLIMLALKVRSQF